MRYWHRERLHFHYRPHIPRPSSVLLHSKPLLVAAIVAAITLGFVVAFANDTLLRIDRPISEFVRGQAWLEHFRWLNTLGSEAQGMVLALVVGLVMWRWCHVFALAFPAAVLAGIAVNLGLKFAVDRPRPPEPLGAVAFASFPSGHALHAVIVFGLLPPAVYILTGSRLAFWVSVVGAVFVTVGVAAIRVYLGAHWPTDVLASMAVGAGLLLVAEYVIASPGRRHRVDCPLHHVDRPLADMALERVDEVEDAEILGEVPGAATTTDGASPLDERRDAVG
jgi:undecaprenyl-diphosphatase